MKKVGTEDNPADMLTKPVISTKFMVCVNLVGLSSE